MNERVLELDGQAISRDGWTVAVAYRTQGGMIRWGTFSHSQKAKARAVWKNLEPNAYMIRLYRRQREVARRDMALAASIELSAGFEWERFLKG